MTSDCALPGASPFCLGLLSGCPRYPPREGKRLFRRIAPRYRYLISVPSPGILGSSERPASPCVLARARPRTCLRLQSLRYRCFSSPCLRESNGSRFHPPPSLRALRSRHVDEGEDQNLSARLRRLLGRRPSALTRWIKFAPRIFLDYYFNNHTAPILEKRVPSVTAKRVISRLGRILSRWRQCERALPSRNLKRKKHSFFFHFYVSYLASTQKYNMFVQIRVAFVHLN